MKVDALPFDVDELTWSFVDMTNGPYCTTGSRSGTPPSTCSSNPVSVISAR